MRVWIDCTAAAHPLVMRPIVERLEGSGHEVRVTAREYGQTQGVLERLGIAYESVGRHADGSVTRKGAAAARRSLSLARWARGHRFDLALGHGSVDLGVVSGALRIPSVQMQDYEYAGLQRQIAFRAARRVLAPDAIPVDAMRRAGAAARKLFRYPGLKEDYYLSDFEREPGRAGRARDRPRTRPGGGAPAARDLGLPRARTLCMRPSLTASPATRARSPSSSRAPRLRRGHWTAG